ncbi:MAG: hypothetical protein IV100_21155 [Myxococcales bacterium]|nr:hypothetical protein [Myxococcales bacterium]
MKSLKSQTILLLSAGALVTLTACHEADSNSALADVMSEVGGSDGTTSDVTPDTTGSDDGGAEDTTGVPPDVDPVVSCQADVDCEDEIDCTIDRCDAGECEWDVAPGQCFIGGQCYSDGLINPQNDCQLCAADAGSRAWADRVSGLCDDGDACTVGESCKAGICFGNTPMPCDDTNPCTADVCDPEVGCISAAIEAECDDGAPCTGPDLCLLGECVGPPLDCDDGDPCTVEGCVQDGCKTAPASDGILCENDDPCISGGTCLAGACAGGAETTCDDGNACTIDACVAGVGCANLPTESPCCLGETNVCDDGDPCTADSCDPVTTDCSYVNAAGPCDDGNLCTGTDTCSDGTCAGAPVVCDDGNPCTKDSCVLGSGCVTSPVDGGPCDDGLACSTGDVCVAGLCKADTTDCNCPVPVGDAAKVATIQISTDAKLGTALDLDSDPATCSPSGSCSGGVHNSFSVLAGLANSALADAVAGGSIILLVNLPADTTGAFDLTLYQGDASDPGCDVSAAVCDYVVQSASFDSTCHARFSLPATLSGAELKAGSNASQIPFSIPIQGVTLDVVVYAARLDATVTSGPNGVTGFTGVLGGAITKEALFVAIDNLPPDGLPVPKELIKTILESTLEYDIDTSGDGVGDAASIALQITGIDANLVGVD